MDWHGIVFSTVFGGVVGGIFWFMGNKGLISKTVSTVIFLVAMSGWNLFYFKVLKGQNDSVIDGMESVMKKIDLPIFLTIRDKDPKVYDELKQEVLTLKKEGKSNDEIELVILNKILALLDSRFLFAPDENIISQASVIVKQMEFLQQKSAEQCFNFIFPTMNENFSDIEKIAKSFPKELYKQRLQADREMLIASYDGKKRQFSVEDGELVLQDLETVKFDLAQKYGDDITLLESLQSGSTDKVKSCDMYIHMNKKILELPPERAARLYRYFVSHL
ncbi:hypothetical protein ABLB69_15940 [Xenorhabdus khoisanae]|uniref:hypothetical protein n=1 Tax=Xenorhabdus khoisanae TaxID=880157 RepID=UPI0023597309|nr:hypothetical protein [Xenorhabdus khoisanae]MDC9614110.1 hypothetical protein [Xenorhabdus khoisanae]